MHRGDCCELHVADSVGCRRVLLWPFDRPAPVSDSAHVAVVPLRTSWHAITAAHARECEPSTPRSRSIGAAVLPYQLEPALAVASGATRVLLADEVGLGKTVQAGWIVSDLIERDRDARVLIAVPAGLRRQWASELERLFGVAVVAVDAAWLRGAVRDVPADISPWARSGVYLASLDFLKRHDVTTSLQSHVWDLLVVDEAHGAAAPTDRHTALARVSAQTRRIVALSATPFSGDASAFLSVASLGGTPADDPPLMFRRSREDVGGQARRRHRFATIRISRAEFRLQRLLERYSRDVWREAAGDVEGARLAVTILRKRALSSPAAAERSIRRRLALLEGAVSTPRQVSFFDDDEPPDDEASDAALAAPGLANAAREERWLAVMADAAAAVASQDSKLRGLIRLLRRIRGEAAIVFTEYRDTLRHIERALPGALQLHGGMTSEERAVVQRRFNDEGGLLLATDAASEGLNLHARCRLVINYEVPWNPARLEQRIGRVDRIGQRRAVHAVTFVARDTAEDLVIANLARRLARVAATLGERDRLAAFLDDARVARSVIGAAPLPAEQPRDPMEVAAVLRPPALQVDADRAADRLRRRGAAAPGVPRIAAASLRAPRGIAPGVVFAIRLVMRAASGDIAAERLVFLHTAGRVHRPRAAADIRQVARSGLDMIRRHLQDAVPDLDAWRRTVEASHTRALDALISRERALSIRPLDIVPVQHGLFDRREAIAADRRGERDRLLDCEHAERIRLLESRQQLTLADVPVAVLVLWR